MASYVLAPIPDRLPISGKKGSERLKRLERRLVFLRERINISTEDRSFDEAEASALEWVIETMLEYETKLAETKRCA